MSNRYLITVLIGSALCLAAGANGQDKKIELDKFKTFSVDKRHSMYTEQVRKVNAVQQDDERHERRKEATIQGNQIRVLLTNWGSISTPSADNTDADLFWPRGSQGLGNAFEFGPLVGAEVIGADGDTLRIVNDGFIRSSDGDFQPGTADKWGWEPRIGFSDPNQNEIATFSDLDDNLDGKPDSWPEIWFNQTLGRYVWPAFLGDDASTPDEEVFYVMDDFDNAEFNYFPFPDDSTKRGLGLELSVRIFQFNNPLAEDLIFLVYTITNVSPKRLDKVFLGMFGDPHVGGPNDFADDFANFISAFNESFPFDTRNMLYAFDEDGVGDGGKASAYFGYRFLESPGISDDGQDNDNDGLVDESPFNAAGTLEFGPIGRFGEPRLHWSGDEDGDWDEEFDDVGVDGIAGTGDFGEGDGKPTQRYWQDLNNNAMLDAGEPTSEFREPGMRFLGGEPNFGFLDTAESDQLGLTSFNALTFGGNNRPRNDDLMWQRMSTPNQRPSDPEPTIEQEADNVFIYGSGAFSLEPGESQRFSIALLLGQDLTDLLNNAQVSQQVFDSDYRFAQAPQKPNVVAVPDDGKVTLYWDTVAETSFDPFVARANPDDPDKGFDFEGYKIYRSRDHSFNDTQTITDSRGIPFLSTPLRQANGVPAQFDIENEFSGLADVEYLGRGVRFDLGNNNGLVHTFVDSNNVQNGVTYFYAVTSYDHGDQAALLAPTESQRTILRDPVTREFTLDVNTAEVVAGPPATGFDEPRLDANDLGLATRDLGDASGKVRVEFIDPLDVQDNKGYEVEFAEIEVDSLTTAIGFSVVDQDQKTATFTARDTIFVNLPDNNIVAGTVAVTDASGAAVDPARYEIDYVQGRIRGASASSMPAGASFTIIYKSAPVSKSLSINSQDDNLVFDGVKIFVDNEETALDPLVTEGGRSGFKTIETNTNFSTETTEIQLSRVGNPAAIDRDFEIHFADYDTTANGDLVDPADSTDARLGGVRAPFRIVDVTTGERVPFFINEVVGLRNKRWDWQETVVLIRPDAAQITETTYQVKFNPPSQEVENDAGDVEIIFDDPVYPGDGDVFLLFSRKPFEAGDAYSFVTRAATFQTASIAGPLDDVIVVPNPYIAFSSSELSGPRSGERDDLRLEFRNLPERCTIRIYTITGELVDTIEKDDPGSFAVWRILTLESQQVAYGVYFYHVDAPGVGTKTGRFALIK